MIGDVLAEHLLLEPEQLRLLELRSAQHLFVDLQGRCDGAAEQRVLSLGLRPTVGQDGDRDLLVPAHTLRVFLQHAAARVPERVERPGQDQALQHLLVQDARVDLAAEVGERLEQALLGPGLGDLLHDPFPDVPHGRQAVPDLPVGRGEVHLRAVHVWRKDSDPHQSHRVQVEGLVVLVVLHAGQERRHELDRVMLLQVGRLVGDQGVRARVRGVEAVVGERDDEVEDLFRLPRLMAPGHGPLDEFLPVRDQLCPDLLAHGLAERVGLPHRIPGQRHGDLHDLLLVDDDPVRRPEDVLQIGVGVGHGLAAVLALGVLDMHVLPERARPVQRVQRHQIFEPVRCELPDELAHPGAF